MMIRAQESSDMESMALSEPSRQADLAVQQGNHEDNVKAAQVATMCGLRVHEWGLNPMFWVGHVSSNARGAVLKVLLLVEVQ